jgi:hypothetical protein
MIKKKQFSGQLIFDDSVKRLWAIRRLPGGTSGVFLIKTFFGIPQASSAL